MVKAELAEKVDGGFRIRGAAGRIEWLADRRLRAGNGGRARRDNLTREQRSEGSRRAAIARWTNARSADCDVIGMRTGTHSTTHPGTHMSTHDACPPAPVPAPAPAPRIPPIPPPSPAAPVTPACAGQVLAAPIGADRTHGNATPVRRRKTELLPQPPADWPQELVAAWGDWQTHRWEIGRPIRATGARQLIAKLSQLGPVRGAAAIRHSIASGWQGIFEPRTKPEASRLLGLVPSLREAQPSPRSADQAFLHDVKVTADPIPEEYFERGIVSCPECGEHGGIVVQFSPRERTAKLSPCESCLGADRGDAETK